MENRDDPVTISDESSEADTVTPRLVQPSDDVDDDEESDSLPLMPKPKSYANIVRNENDDDDDDDDDETETEILQVKPTVEIKESDSDDDSDDDSTPVVGKFRNHSKWSESDDDDESESEPPVGNVREKKRVSSDEEDDTETEVMENALEETEQVGVPAVDRTELEEESRSQEHNGNIEQQRTDSVSSETPVERIIQHESPIESEGISEGRHGDPAEEDCCSEPGSVSPSSLAEMLEEQIQNWYDEDGLRRPKRQSREIYEKILQQGIDISDLVLTEEERRTLTDEIHGMEQLTLDDLLYKINANE